MSQFFLFDNETLNGKISLNNKSLKEYMPNNLLQKNVLLEDSSIVIELSKEEQAKAKLAGSIASLQALNSANIGIMKTTFPKQDYDFDWYKETKISYNIVKEHANKWYTSIAPAITSDIPGSIVKFTPRFQFYAKDILSILESSSEITLKKILIIERFQQILENSINIADNFKNYSHKENGQSKGTINDWAYNMLNACMSFNDESKDVGKKINEIKTEIEQYKNMNDNIDIEIKRYNDLIITGGALMGGGAFVTGTIGGPLLFYQPIAGGIALFIGIGSFITGATVVGVYAEKLKDKYREKTEIISKLNKDQQLLLSLEDLKTTTKLVNNSYNTMLNNTHKFIISWSNMSEKIDSVIFSLQKEEGSVLENKFKDIKFEIEHSLSLWNSIYDYACQLQNSANLEPEIINKDAIIQ